MWDTFFSEFFILSAVCSSLRRKRDFQYIFSIDRYAILRSIHGFILSIITLLGLTWKYGEKKMIYEDKKSKTHQIYESAFDSQKRLSTYETHCEKKLVYGRIFFFFHIKNGFLFFRDDFSHSSRNRYFCFFSSSICFRKSRFLK